MVGTSLINGSKQHAVDWINKGLNNATVRACVRTRCCDLTLLETVLLCD